ncbi:uncharacterized protein LOC112056624 [Bicyclus anynana]|uniref:Uncharacterized protein LOC112056624 n=1 Tax=Bicyclus anynana TaxID=110368 RepID=A0ABM3LS40_BICAN|nr:uncharacterized protein LOC112056624 [Bicyclus anynana]
MGQLYEIDVRGRTREGDKEIHMFLKHVIPGEAIKSLLSVDISYSNEVFFYNKLCDIYNRLQENANNQVVIKRFFFNFQGENNQEVVVIDYQFLFYRSPVTDIMHFIYTGTDRKFREAHMNDLKDLYHKELTEFLQYFDLNGNDVYPREVYDKDFEDSLDYGLMIGLYVLPIIFTEEDKFPDFGKESINNMSFKMSNRHKDRITEIVEEYLENGILN